MTIEHTLLGAYLLAAGSGVVTGLIISVFTMIFARVNGGAFGKWGGK